VEARAVKARADIKSIHIRATVRADSAMHRPADRRQFNEVLEVYQSPAGHRKDRRAVGDGILNPTGIRRELTCRGCGPDGGFVEFQPPKGSLNIYPKNTPNAEAINFGLTDPRRLGYNAGFYLARGEVNSVVGSGLVRYSGVERGVFNGDEALIVRGEVIKSPGTTYACWVIPAKGYNVARIEVTQPAHPGLPSFGESELALDAPSGVWFPRRYTSKVFFAGQQTHDEYIDVTVAEFNRVPDDVFTMTALDLPKNEPCFDHRTKRPAFWTGTAIKDKPDLPPTEDQVVRPAVAPEPAQPLPTRSWDRLLAAAACVVLAVVAVGMIRRVVFR
jgi:hypothetical protein